MRAAINVFAIVGAVSSESRALTFPHVGAEPSVRASEPLHLGAGVAAEPLEGSKAHPPGVEGIGSDVLSPRLRWIFVVTVDETYREV